MNKTDLTYLVQVGGAVAMLFGVINSVHHLTVVIPVVAGAVAFEIGGYLRSHTWKP
ncbi:MAG: hypothetical protein ACREF8_02375 [Chthoniobacterales bacterium]